MGLKGISTTSNCLKYEEYIKLLDGLHKDREYFWELYARLAFCTACRASDLLKFHWRDILGKPLIELVEQKTKKIRRITVNHSVRRKISELWNLMGSPDIDTPVFAGDHTGEPVSIQYINRRLKLMKYRYGLHVGNFSTHSFRKTFGRYVYDTSKDKAASLILLNRILHHANIETTKTYIGITQDEIDAVYNSITF